MREKCPKCGATVANCGPNVWSCGTARTPKGVLHESKNCLRRQLAQRDKTIARIHDYGIDTKSFGDGDANAVWNRVDAFRDDPEAVLAPEDVRELAEWWAELHTTVSILDEKLCMAERDAREAIAAAEAAKAEEKK